jgi:hypothetical protein
MPTSPTLHHFVCRLLHDPQAKAAYDADPDRVLREAGLGELGASDVEDVIPLVLDFAPATARPADGARSW